MYIEQDPVPVLEGFDGFGQPPGPPPVTSTILATVPPGTVLTVRAGSRVEYGGKWRVQLLAPVTVVTTSPVNLVRHRSGVFVDGMASAVTRGALVGMPTVARGLPSIGGRVRLPAGVSVTLIPATVVMDTGFSGFGAFTPEGQWVPGPPNRPGLVPSPWCPARQMAGFGAQRGLVLAAGSRVTLQADTELDVQEATDVAEGVAFTKKTRVRLLDTISARLKGPLQVFYEETDAEQGTDLVKLTTNDDAQIELDAGVRAMVVETGDTVTSARAGEAMLPAGSKVQQAGAVPSPGGGTTGTVLSQSEMNLIWGGRAMLAGSAAALAATAGTVTTFVLAARGQKRAAWAAGIVGVLATAAGVGVAVFAARHIDVRT